MLRLKPLYEAVGRPKLNGVAINDDLCEPLCFFLIGAPDIDPIEDLAIRAGHIGPVFFHGVDDLTTRLRYVRYPTFLLFARSQQPGVMPLDRFVALTRAVLQGFRINDLDFPAGVLDQAGRLQRVRLDCHSCPSNPKHFREILLREVQRIGARQVSRPQQPTAETCLNMVCRKTCRRLLRLSIYGLLVAN